ncbi:galactose mutarotase-like domain-containing protein [Lineolata rhizophorae]|uniref:Glucose-6-phosphate 1-epimerase n=1 Tax=Lineolata rhizophorae TaxID=578093 RepID=A0A6A6NQW5_9PEZI|nr:galactose mutarotase-like domain-containing protein [Lineolata rhizophorae]
MVDRPNKPSAIAPAASAPQPTVDIADDNSSITATLPSGENVTVLLHGATVTSWKSGPGAEKKENLWVSEKAVLDGSKPVRGGIPLVFPIFGAPPANHATSKLPQHGFARNLRWEYLGKSTSESTTSGDAGTGPTDNSVKLDFGLYSANLTDEQQDQWPYDFGLVYSVTLSRDTLQTMLNVRNEGQLGFDFQMLLHTYFRIGDIGSTAITGLSGVTYTDKVLNATEHAQAENAVRIAGETDRVYKRIPQSTTSIVEGDKPRFDVVRDNLPDTVVWNPFKEKAAAMADFAPDGDYVHMVCVEAGYVSDWVRLEPGDTWEGGQRLRSLL